MTSTEWHEVSPGHHQRDLDPMERAYSIFTVLDPGTGKRHWTIVSAIKLSSSVEDIRTPLREAWIQLRYDQPNLASLIDREKEVRTYTSASEPRELEEWLTETFQDLDSPSAREANRKLSDVGRPTLYILPKSQELMVRAPHATIDGIGTVLLWQELLNILSNPKPRPVFGSEASNLSPIFSIAAKLPPVTTKHVELAKVDIANFFGSVPGIGLPFKGTAPSNFDVIPYTFSSALSTEIIAACKSQGLTPTHALHTAIIIANRRLDVTSPPSRTYDTFAPFNLRRFLSPETRKYSVANYIAGWLIKVTPPTSGPSRAGFLELAKTVKEYYVESIKNTEKLLASDPWYEGLISVVASIPADAPPPPPYHEANLSTIGIVESNLRRSYPQLEVEGFWLGLEILSPQIVCHSWTFDGVLTMQCSYNEGFYTVEDVKEFQKVVKEVLLDGLDVKE